jgi:peptidyl-prolyl cis-trans isomerase SurA
MPLNKIQMKFINSRIIFIFFLLLFSSTTIIAQEIIRDTVVEPVKKVKTNQRQKIDGIIATVGDFIILDSDIDKSYLNCLVKVIQ